MPSSIPDDCSQAVQGQIVSFLSSVPNGSTIQFQPGGCYGQNGTIYVTDRSDLIIDGNGSTFKSLVGQDDASNWEVQAGSNITFENLTIQGDNPYAGILQGDPGCYTTSLEWQYGIAFDGTQGGTVNSVHIYDVYGDFVEAQDDLRVGVYNSPPSRNIMVENSYFDGNGRMGVGLTDVIGFTMQNTTMNDVCWDAVDVELDVNQEYGLDINIIDNTFGPMNFALLSNYGAGYGDHVGNITVSGNTETVPPATTESPISIGQVPGTYRSNYTISNNYLLDLGGNGIEMAGIDNSTIENNAVLYASDQGGSPVGILLSDCHAALIEDNAFTGGTFFGHATTGFPGGISSIDSLSTGITLIGNIG